MDATTKAAKHVVITPRFAAAVGGRKLDGANSVRNIDLLHFGGGMKTYFLQFDFWNKDVDKFFCGVVDIDLSKDGLLDVCRKIIDDKFYPIRPADVEIKVKAFNNIEM